MRRPARHGPATHTCRRRQSAGRRCRSGATELLWSAGCLAGRGQRHHDRGEQEPCGATCGGAGVPGLRPGQPRPRARDPPRGGHHPRRHQRQGRHRHRTTGATSKAKDHAAAACGLRQALGAHADAATAEKALRELIAVKGDVEYGTTLMTLAETEAEPLLRRAQTLVDLAHQIVRPGHYAHLDRASTKTRGVTSRGDAGSCDITAHPWRCDPRTRRHPRRLDTGDRANMPRHRVASM